MTGRTRIFSATRISSAMLFASLCFTSMGSTSAAAAPSLKDYSKFQPSVSGRHLEALRDAALDAGVNPLVLAAVGLIETNLNHCLSDWGPAPLSPFVHLDSLKSEYCGGKAVFATKFSPGKTLDGLGLLNIQPSEKNMAKFSELNIDVLTAQGQVQALVYVIEKRWPDFGKESESFDLTSPKAKDFADRLMLSVVGTKQHTERFLKATEALQNCIPSAFWESAGSAIQFNPTCL